MDKVVDKIFDLYLIQSNHYLLQIPGGDYVTRKAEKGDRKRSVRRFMVEKHLEGKTTLGTFSGRYLTKFLCFDVDYVNATDAKWATYKLAHALESVGVRDFAVSFSGNKGYHVDVFLDRAISVTSARRFYEHITEIADIADVQGGQVEFRPTATQGVKLPLGTHQKTGTFCGFCRIEDGLAVMDRDESVEYFMSAKKTDASVILNAVAEESPTFDRRDAEEMEDAVSRYTPLPIYDQSESYTLRHAAERYANGLRGPGQRHNSILLLARLMNHNGVDEDEAVEQLTEWMAWQDTRLYSSDWDFCVKDIREAVKYVYTKNLTLTPEAKDLSVSLAEIDSIIRMCSEKNQKALAYAMLVHSKRWAGEDGAFYMTYRQMETAAGVEETTVWRQLKKLEKVGVIEVISRNRKQKGTKIKRPNYYRMMLQATSIEGDKLFSLAAGGGLVDCLRYFYGDSQLRSLLPRRQYTSLIVAK
ncbi:hypothetical protein P4V64_19445 [Bacillus thuringiensis]|nr:hypothetical protein [Bacillus thuringiensis]